jgi:dienelactone hydrolase
MFQFFPGNYVWNTATSMAIAMGGHVMEIDEACRPLKEAAQRNDAGAQEDFFQSWGRLGERIETLGARDEAAGNHLAAGRKLVRAAIYHMMAERMLHPFDPRRAARYRRMLDCFRAGVTLRREPVEFVEIPYGAQSLPALFVPGEGKGPHPCLVHLDGFDGMKEMLYLMGLAQELRLRGVATVILDQPGVGECVRLRDIFVEPEAEKPAGAALDWLATRGEVDAGRASVLGISLGGYYAPRAAAFDPRFRCCVAWGASWDYGKLTRERLHNLRHIERSVSHWPDHFRWVFGTKTAEEALPISARMTLEGVIERLACPFLIVHGENDRQTALADARRVLDAAVNAPERELRVMTLGEGGSEHCNIDNMTLAVDHIAEWVARRLGAARG